jgi:hypothetical protein
MGRIRGRVVSQLFGAGTKSERRAVMLVTGGGAEYILRRAGGNAFRDPKLEALVGREIEAEGTLRGYTFILEKYRAR